MINLHLRLGFYINSLPSSQSERDYIFQKRDDSSLYLINNSGSVYLEGRYRRSFTVIGQMLGPPLHYKLDNGIMLL